MNTDWEAIDEFWAGFTTDHEALFIPSATRVLPDISVAEEWDTVDTFWDGYVADHAPDLELLETLLATVCSQWQTPSGAFSSDPLTADWGPTSSQDGPLRPTSHEEEWSQWLAHLLRTSSGPFISELLGLPNRPAQTVRREIEFSDADSTRRIDILVEYPDTAASIEVKNGDRHLTKTPETARLIEQSTTWSWTHILLLQRENQRRLHRTFGEAVTSDAESRPTIENQDTPAVDVRYWDDVSRTLRRMLTEGLEADTHWQASAYLFITLIEQRILTLESMDLLDSQLATDSAGSQTLHRLIATDPEQQIQYLQTLIAEDSTHE